jgi:hypothetical protein
MAVANGKVPWRNSISIGGKNVSSVRDKDFSSFSVIKGRSHVKRRVAVPIFVADICSLVK